MPKTEDKSKTTQNINIILSVAELDHILRRKELKLVRGNVMATLSLIEIEEDDVKTLRACETRIGALIDLVSDEEDLDLDDMDDLDDDDDDIEDPEDYEDDDDDVSDIEDDLDDDDIEDDEPEEEE